MTSLNYFTEFLSFVLGIFRGALLLCLLWRFPCDLDFCSSRCSCNATHRSHSINKDPSISPTRLPPAVLAHKFLFSPMILTNFWFTSIISFKGRLLVAVSILTVAQCAAVAVARLAMVSTVSCWISCWRSSMVTLLEEW